LTIVTYAHRPKRPPRKAQAAAIIGPAVVTSASKRRHAQPPAETEETDPEAAEKMRAWLRRAMQGHGPSAD
jgi:hypothetical protein